jgi:hypothetical protein
VLIGSMQAGARFALDSAQVRRGFAGSFAPLRRTRSNRNDS